MNVPKLRFKEFNEELNTFKIKDTGNVITGMTPSTADKENYGTEYLWVSPGDMGYSKYIANTKTKLSLKGFNKTRQLPDNSILVTCIGSTIGKMGMSNSTLSTNQQINSIIPTKIFNPNYLYYCINYNFPKFLNKISFQAVPIISKSEFEKLEIKCTPNLSEQEKIGNILDLLDKKIELQSKKIEDLKLFKKGLINHIIENNEIEKISLKNILVEQNNKTSKNNEYEILSSTSKGIYLQKDYFNKQAASDNNVGYKILKKNQLVLSPQNLWMGNINVNTEYNIGIVSPSYKIFNISNNINIDFFNYWIKSPKALFEYKISSEQGASIVRRNLNMDLFYKIIVDVPRGKLQNKVGKIIKLLNLNIQYNEFLLQKLSELKKGFMQNMFV